MNNSLNFMNILLKVFFTLITLLVFEMNISPATIDPKERTIVLSGKILDRNLNEMLSGVSITTTASEKTMYSDLNGHFFMYIRIKDEKEFKLEFSQVGYRTKTLTVADIESIMGNLEVSLLEE